MTRITLCLVVAFSSLVGTRTASGGVSLATLPSTLQQSALPNWMIGCWAGEDGGDRFHERWLAADTATLLAVAHTTRAGKVRAFEFLRVILRDGKGIYIAQPDGAPPTEFVATETTASRVIFENAAHDFPKRVTYERPADDQLIATIDGGEKSGKRVRFAMRREPCGG